MGLVELQQTVRESSLLRQPLELSLRTTPPLGLAAAFFGLPAAPHVVRAAHAAATFALVPSKCRAVSVMKHLAAIGVTIALAVIVWEGIKGQQLARTATTKHTAALLFVGRLAGWGVAAVLMEAAHVAWDVAVDWGVAWSGYLRSRKSFYAWVRTDASTTTASITTRTVPHDRSSSWWSVCQSYAEDGDGKT